MTLPPPRRPQSHRALIEVNLTIGEVGHLLEGVHRDEHGADIGLGDEVVKDHAGSWLVLPFTDA